MFGDLIVKSLFLFLILGLKSDDLNSSVFTDPGNILETLVLFLGLLFHIGNFLREFFGLISRACKLLSEDIDLTLQFSVVGFGLVENDTLRFKSSIGGLDQNFSFFLLFIWRFLFDDIFLPLF